MDYQCNKYYNVWLADELDLCLVCVEVMSEGDTVTVTAPLVTPVQVFTMSDTDDTTAVIAATPIPGAVVLCAFMNMLYMTTLTYL